MTIIWLVEGGEYDGRYIAGAFEDEGVARKFNEVGRYGEVFPVHLNAGSAEIRAGLKITTIYFNVAKDEFRYGGGYYKPEYNSRPPGHLVIHGDTSGEIVLFAVDVADAIHKAMEIVDRAMKMFYKGKLIYLNVDGNGEITDKRQEGTIW